MIEVNDLVRLNRKCIRTLRKKYPQYKIYDGILKVISLSSDDKAANDTCFAKAIACLGTCVFAVLDKSVLVPKNATFNLKYDRIHVGSLTIYRKVKVQKAFGDDSVLMLLEQKLRKMKAELN